MDPHNQAKVRHDGWTPERRSQFLAFLAAGIDVSSACRGVGLSREAAYRLRRRDPAFALVWEDALRSARKTAEQAWLAMLPQRLLRTMSELSGECKLPEPGRPRSTVSGLWRECKLRTGPQGASS
jgi:hypothetical protein